MHSSSSSNSSSSSSFSSTSSFNVSVSDKKSERPIGEGIIGVYDEEKLTPVITINALNVNQLMKFLSSNRDFKKICLKEDYHDSTGISDFMYALSQNNISLTSLTIINISDAGINALADALKTNKTLTSLTLLHEEFICKDSTCIDAVAAMLLVNHTLTSVVINNNFNCNLSLFAPVFRENTTLTSLKIPIIKSVAKPEEMKSLTEALNSNVTLTSLEFFINQTNFIDTDTEDEEEVKQVEEETTKAFSQFEKLIAIQIEKNKHASNLLITDVSLSKDKRSSSTETLEKIKFLCDMKEEKNNFSEDAPLLTSVDLSYLITETYGNSDASIVIVNEEKLPSSFDQLALGKIKENPKTTILIAYMNVLKCAAYYGLVDTVSFLIESRKDRDLNTDDPFGSLSANYFPDIGIIELPGAIKLRRTLSPIQLAILQKHFKIAEMLQAAGADINFHNSLEDPILHRLTRANNADTISEFIRFGANIHATDKYGNTALHRAAFYGNQKNAEVLIQSGALITARAKGNGNRRQVDIAMSGNRNNHQMVYFLRKAKEEKVDKVKVRHQALIVAQGFRSKESFFSRLPAELCCNIITYFGDHIDEQAAKGIASRALEQWPGRPSTLASMPVPTPLPLASSVTENKNAAPAQLSTNSSQPPVKNHMILTHESNSDKPLIMKRGSDLGCVLKQLSDEKQICFIQESKLELAKIIKRGKDLEWVLTMLVATNRMSFIYLLDMQIDLTQLHLTERELHRILSLFIDGIERASIRSALLGDPTAVIRHTISLEQKEETRDLKLLNEATKLLLPYTRTNEQLKIIIRVAYEQFKAAIHNHQPTIDSLIFCRESIKAVLLIDPTAVQQPGFLKRTNPFRQALKNALTLLEQAFSHNKKPAAKK